jgi:D-alanine-D-alanine ligase
VGGEQLDPAAALAALSDVDVFFLALHGGAGEDGTLQGLLESAGRVYTGSGVRASALCMDKLATRGLAAACGLRTAAGVAFTPDAFAREPQAWLARIAALPGEERVVKPRCGGSSVATSLVPSGGDLQQALADVLATGDDCLVEARVEGVECSCGVLGNRGEPLRALPPIEIRPASGRFFDYQQKYAADGAREVCPVESLDAAVLGRVQARAVALYAAAGCDGYARVDFIVPADGEPVLLEANTLPGFTARSLLPQEAAVAGIDYRSLVLWVIEAALRRRGGRS